MTRLLFSLVLIWGGWGGWPVAVPTPTATVSAAGCHVRGALQDSTCTPGAYNPDVTQATIGTTICVSGWTSTVRSVPVRERMAVFAEYAIAYPPPSSAYEIDHLVSLELGGANALANLWPEAASPVPGFHQKDVLESAAKRAVCSGRITLDYARHAIITNWVGFYDWLVLGTAPRPGRSGARVRMMGAIAGWGDCAISPAVAASTGSPGKGSQSGRGGSSVSQGIVITAGTAFIP